MRKHYRYTWAPAVAGLLLCGAACDNEDDTAARTTPPPNTTPRQTPAPTAGDRAQPAGGMETARGGATVTDEQVQQVTEAVAQAKQTNDSFTARIEANAEIETWGTGDQAREHQSRITQALDTIDAAVRQKDWDRTATNVRTLMTQPMPLELKQHVATLTQRLRTLGVPQLQNLEMPQELPTAPGTVPPREGGGTPPGGMPPGGGSDRPGGA